MLKIDEVCKRIPVCALYSKSVQKIVQSSRWWIKWISSSPWNLSPNHMMRQLQMFASGNWYFCLGYWNYWKGGSIFLKTRACERGTTSSRLKFYESKSKNLPERALTPDLGDPIPFSEGRQADGAGFVFVSSKQFTFFNFQIKSHVETVHIFQFSNKKVMLKQFTFVRPSKASSSFNWSTQEKKVELQTIKVYVSVTLTQYW